MDQFLSTAPTNQFRKQAFQAAIVLDRDRQEIRFTLHDARRLAFQATARTSGVPEWPTPNLVPATDLGLDGVGAWFPTNGAAAPSHVATGGPNNLGYLTTTRADAGEGLAITALSLPHNGTEPAALGYWVRVHQNCQFRASLAFYDGGSWRQESGSAVSMNPADGWQWVTYNYTPTNTPIDTVQLRVRLDAVQQGDRVDWSLPFHDKTMTAPVPPTYVSGGDTLDPSPFASMVNIPGAFKAAAFTAGEWASLTPDDLQRTATHLINL